MNFYEFYTMLENTNSAIWYHGTSKENAESIIKNGIDINRYKSGTFTGFYLTSDISYFPKDTPGTQHSKKPEAVLKIEIDASKILDLKDFDEKKLLELDPYLFNPLTQSSPVWKNTLIQKYAIKNGYGGVKLGGSVAVLFDNSPVRSVKYQWIRKNKETDDYEISENIMNGDFSSKEEMIKKYSQMSKQEKESLWQFIEEVNKKNYAKRLGTNNPVLLHHGSPNAEIDEFKLTKGKRSLGFMGATYDIDNQGIFFSDSKSYAHFFGQNRSQAQDRYVSNPRIYDAYVNLDKVLDLTDHTKMPINLKKIGLQLLNKYEGTNKKKLANMDIWWLLDKPLFIEQIKEAGFTGVIFKEAHSIKKEVLKHYKVSGTGNTYLIFYPQLILIKNNKNDLIQDIDGLYKYFSKDNINTQ